MIEIKGWERENGDVGIRNYIIVLPSVACANYAVKEICKKTKAIPILHNQGTCGEFGEDRKQTLRTLVNIGSHPNVAFTLVVGLGCEQVDAHKLADEIRKKGRECDSLLIQEEGEKKVIEKGVKIIQKVKNSVKRQKTKSFSIGELVVGVKCGASDYSSALFSNPAVGIASDFLIEHSGTVMFGERLEVVGAEHIIAKRAKDREVKKDFLRRIKKAIKDASKAGVDWIGSQPSLGNIKGGLSTIEEKSLGAIKKAGSKTLVGCLDYAERPRGKGLYFMDTPGYDVQCVSGLAAGGCHEILFTTGRGTYLGSPVSPVIKISANPLTCKKFKDAIDVDLSKEFEVWDLKEAGRKVIDKIIKVARGEKTLAEKAGHIEFSIERIGPTA